MPSLYNFGMLLFMILSYFDPCLSLKLTVCFNYNQMMKQLLIIFKILLAVHATCSISSEIPQLTITTANLVNINLNTTFQDFELSIKDTSSSTYAIAITQIDASNFLEWNLTIVNVAARVIVSFKHSFVSWVKLSCIILASSRNDLALGSSFLQPSFQGQQVQAEVSIKSIIKNYQTSLAIVFLNGYKVETNNNKSIALGVSPFQIKNSSFMVNITISSSNVSYILISYVIFSPINANFDAYGDQVKLQLDSKSRFQDVSQQIPNTPYKFYGIFQIESKKSQNIDFQLTIEESFTAKVSSRSTISLKIQYLYFLPTDYTCPRNCNASIIYNNSCYKSCPEGTILSNNGQISFCTKCSLGLMPNLNQTLCICIDGFAINEEGICAKILNKSTNFALNETKQTTVSYASPSTNFTNIPRLNISEKQPQNSSSQTKQVNISKNQPFSEESKEVPKTIATNYLAENSTLNSSKPMNQSSLNSNSTAKLANQTVGIKNSSASKVNNEELSLNCSKISNSLLVNNKCLCKVGYVNLSNNCIPIVNLGNPYTITSNTSATPSVTVTPSPPQAVAITVIKPTPVCLQNQSFSITLNKCICNAGFQMNLTKCVPICSNIQVFNIATNSCICIVGYTRVNNQCIPCSNTPQFSLGNETCYRLLTKKDCRNNYILQNEYCISCLGITISLKINSTCSVCQNGFTYNGFQCVCSSSNQIINGSCIGSACGNKKIDAGETCDDGNTINDDGCSSLCLIEKDFYCSGIPSTCNRTICGNGIVTGGEECDDNNTANGDGCSSLCLVETNFTCLGPLSSCFKMSTGNLSLVSINSNTNNIFVIFQTPRSYAFPNSAFMQTFLGFKFMTKNISPGIVYCQQQILNLSRFDCLIIFPNGVPIVDFIMNFYYNYNDTTGSILVYFSTKNKN